MFFCWWGKPSIARCGPRRKLSSRCPKKERMARNFGHREPEWASLAPHQYGRPLAYDIYDLNMVEQSLEEMFAWRSLTPAVMSTCRRSFRLAPRFARAPKRQTSGQTSTTSSQHPWPPPNPSFSPPPSIHTMAPSSTPKNGSCAPS